MLGIVRTENTKPTSKSVQAATRVSLPTALSTPHSPELGLDFDVNVFERAVDEHREALAVPVPAPL